MVLLNVATAGPQRNSRAGLEPACQEGGAQARSALPGPPRRRPSGFRFRAASPDRIRPWPRRPRERRRSGVRWGTGRRARARPDRRTAPGNLRASGRAVAAMGLSAGEDDHDRERRVDRCWRDHHRRSYRRRELGHRCRISRHARYTRQHARSGQSREIIRSIEGEWANDGDEASCRSVGGQFPPFLIRLANVCACKKRPSIPDTASAPLRSIS